MTVENKWSEKHLIMIKDRNNKEKEVEIKFNDIERDRIKTLEGKGLNLSMLSKSLGLDEILTMKFIVKDEDEYKRTLDKLAKRQDALDNQE